MIAALLLILFTSIATAKNCIPQWEDVPYPHFGKYHRFHPSGNYVLYSVAGAQGGKEPEVMIVDISKTDSKGKRIVKPIPTNMAFEAAPLEPTWEYITTAPRSHEYDLALKGSLKDPLGFRFYKFKDLLQMDSSNYTNLKPAMVEPSFSTIYHSIVEIEKSDSASKYKMTNYDENRMNIYEVQKQPDERTDLKRLTDGKFCGNLTSAFEEKYQRVLAKKSQVNWQIENEPTKAPELNKEKTRLAAEIADLRNLAYLATPILSKDGKYLATKYGNPHAIKVYELNDKGDCKLIRDTGYDGSKVSFSYPKQGELPQIVFTSGNWQSGQNQIIHYDLNADKVQILNRDEDGDTQLAGFTEDGRVMYATRKGFVIVDAKRMTSQQKTCTESSAKASRSKTSASKSKGQR